MLTLGSPFALLLLPLAVLFLERREKARILRIFRRKRTVESKSIAFASRVTLAELPLTIRARLRSPILSALACCAFILLVAALARPQTVVSIAEVESSAHDVMLALDISGSMRAVDFELDEKRVNRLTALKFVVNRFIDQRPGDRIGLIVFGDKVFTQCPLTLDHAALKNYVERLDVGMAGQGTAIGDAIGIALKRMKDIPAESRVITLVTDGKSNSGSLSPLSAAKLAADLKVKIHTIGVGGPEPAPFPEKNAFGQEVLVERALEYDENTLQNIASSTGGRYFNAKTLEGLQSIYDEIDKLELRKVSQWARREYEEHFFWPLLAGFVLLSLYLLLDATVFMKLP